MLRALSWCLAQLDLGRNEASEDGDRVGVIISEIAAEALRRAAEQANERINEEAHHG